MLEVSHKNKTTVTPLFSGVTVILFNSTGKFSIQLS
jgi:hypothetical protein